MYHERVFVLMLSPRSIAPMRHVCGREKEQRRCTKQFCLTVQSAVAWSQLLTSWERNRREENASCCDPDKGPRERQVHPPSSGTCQTRADELAAPSGLCQDRNM